MKIDEKTKKKIKIIVISIIIVIILWFLVVSPILKFKKNEKVVKEAAQRYYEINSGQLPTGEKVKTVALQTLYDKDFINEDLRSSYMNKVCDSKVSWVKVKKENREYKYYVYLKCGIFSSKVDHKGPEIKLKGEDEITINKGEEYKESGIDSVVDDTDGKMNIKDVKIDNTKVNTNKIGTYEVTYKIKDSFNNETVKVRTVKVIETLNHIVEKDTGKNKVYQGSQYNNYVKLDGILFKIVGENEDGTVKIVSDENLAAVNYEGIDSWLNDYFYDKLSDSAKKLIVKSKWCNETVSNPENYTKCNSYGKKSYVGLLSVADINNSKGDDGSSAMQPSLATWTSNIKSNKEAWVNNYYDTSKTESKDFYNGSKANIVGIAPTINIEENIKVISGIGSYDNPYILAGNKTKTKQGDYISTAPTGVYIDYSGYIWRVIDSNKGESTKIIMQDPISNGDSPYYTQYDEKLTVYNPERKENIAYKIENELSTYLKTNYFIKKEFVVNKYNENVLYNNYKSQKKYNLKMHLTSVFDLYSANTNEGVSTWYIDVDNSKVYINSATVGVISSKFDKKEINGIRLVSYLNKDVVIKSGAGTEDDPYTITK